MSGVYQVVVSESRTAYSMSSVYVIPFTTQQAAETYSEEVADNAHESTVTTIYIVLPSGERYQVDE